MPRALKAKRFTSALVPFVLALVRRGGKDAEKLQKKHLKARAANGAAGLEVSLPELGALMTDAAKVLGDDSFGLHAALSMGRGSYGLMEFALRSAPTGRVAMEQLAKYGALINPLVRWSLEVHGDDIELHHRAPTRGGVGRQANVFTVARILQIAREMMGDDVTPLRAWFAHDEKQCPPELASHLRTEAVSFGRSSNGLALSATVLARTPSQSDVELNRALELHGEAVLAACGDDDVYERTRSAVRELLPRNGATLEKTAKRLHVTARTLQRRLTEEGLSFGGVLNEVRRSEAERLLLGDEKLADVAERVGYRDTAAFVRAFRGWTGTTPGRFRGER